MKMDYLHGDNISFLFRHVVVGVGVLADNSIQTSVGHLSVSRARQIH